MKLAACILSLAAVLAVVSADSDAGHFIPKAFYTLDSDGRKSSLHAVNPHTANYLRRLRRQVVSSSSSSSSASVTGSDGVTHFTSQVLNSHTPQVAFSSRFGGSENDVLPTGHLVQTSDIIEGDGKVYFKTYENHF